MRVALRWSAVVGGCLSLIVVGVGGELKPAVYSPEDQAKILVAQHLLELKVDDPLTWIRNESYWQTVFASKKKSHLFPKIWPDLHRTLLDVPLMRGKQVSGSHVLIQAILGSLRPLPLVPVGQLTRSDRQKINSFADGPLARLSKETHNPEAELSDAIADVSFEAARIFKSAVMLERVQGFTDVLPSFRLEGKEIDVIDQAERLNELLHLYGLHLVVHPEALDEGMVILSAYKINKIFNVTVAGESLGMALVDPVFEPAPYNVLGHFEEGNVMLLFENRIQRHVEDLRMFVEESASALISGDPIENTVLASGGLTPEESILLEQHARSNLSEVLGSTMNLQALRNAVTLSVAHHEGYHKILDEQLDEARRQGKLRWEDLPVWSEAGAYLYQLESADPEYILFDLFMVVATALQSHVDFDANREGARKALARLQAQISHIRFWNDQHEPIPTGLSQLFHMPGPDLKSKATEARRKFEQEL